MKTIDEPIVSTPTTEPAATTYTVETSYEGPFGTGTIRKLPTGGREVSINFLDGRTVTAESTCVDLDAMVANTLTEALYNALHKTNTLLLFEKVTVSGTKALVICFRRPKNPVVGYATVIKKGTPSLRFALDRIDLEAMKAPDTMKALRKIAWETGSVKLKK